MAEQEHSDNSGVAPQPTDRLFFAVYPDPATAERISHLARRLLSEHGLHGNPFATQRLHVTLHYLGDHVGVPDDIVTSACAAAAATVAAPCDLRFDRVASFDRKRRKRPLVLLSGDEATPLVRMRDALGEAMVAAGLERWVSPHFTPHVTLLYDDRRLAERAVEPIGWTAHEFVLMRSVLGQTRHMALGRWPLCG